MKVADVMHTHIVSIAASAPISEGARLIFSLGIGAIAVVHDKKLVGILTGHDILSRMYPTIEDIIEDFAHAADRFEQIEENIGLLVDTPISKVMNTQVTTVHPDTPLMRAQSLMLTKRFSHLPIVNGKNELVGIISQGDIFRRLVRKALPQFEKERFLRFIQNHYDSIVDWRTRMSAEFPTLSRLFKKENVRRIVDLGVFTGEHTIRLSKKGGYRIVGLDHHASMIDRCEEKRNTLPDSLKKRLTFALTDFTDLSDIMDVKADAAICMGNALPYLPVTPTVLIKQTASIVRDRNPLLIIQLLNIEKILAGDRLLRFTVEKSRRPGLKEHLFIEFLETQKGGRLFHQVVVFDSDGTTWVFRGVKSIPIRRVGKADLEKALQKAGFHSLAFCGGQNLSQGLFGTLNFDEPFDEQKSDWLTVLAKK